MSGWTLRPCGPDDLDRVTDYAVAGMRAELYPGLRVARYQVGAMVARLSNGQLPGFHRVAVDDRGELVGIVAALAVPMLFFERHEAVVIACRATLPGAGHALLRELKTWADQSMAIRRVVWPIECHAPAGTLRLARRLGFKQVSHTCTYEKE